MKSRRTSHSRKSSFDPGISDKFSARPVIFDQTKATFKFERFIKQLLVHIGFPFFLFLSPNIYAQGFLNPKVIE